MAEVRGGDETDLMHEIGRSWGLLLFFGLGH